MKVKVITGFREEQHYTLDSEEAHKAYYLFLHPEQRAVFANGVALIGKDIRGIEPDYNATMGWHPSHQLEGDDWNKIKARGVDVDLRNLLQVAKDIAYIGKPDILALPLSKAKEK